MFGTVQLASQAAQPQHVHGRDVFEAVNSVSDPMSRRFEVTAGAMLDLVLLVALFTTTVVFWRDRARLRRENEQMRAELKALRDAELSSLRERALDSSRRAS